MVKIYLKSIFYNLFLILPTWIPVVFVLDKIGDVLGVIHFHSNMVMVSGIILVLVGLCIRIWASVVFYCNNMTVQTFSLDQKKLITQGQYRFSRNPLYLGLGLVIFGLILISGSTFCLFFIPINFIVWNYFAVREEKQLTRLFGNEYLKYKQQTRKWL